MRQSHFALAILTAVNVWSCKSTNKSAGVKEASTPNTAATPTSLPDLPPLQLTPFEHPPADENADIEQIMKYMQASEHADHDSGSQVWRFTHAKTLGCAPGTFTVNADLPANLQVGLFKKPGAQFKTWARFSSQEKRIRPDSELDNRGMSIKLIGVPGEKIIGYGDPNTLDIVMTQGQSFFMDSVKDFRTLVESNLPGGIGAVAWFQQHPYFYQTREGLLVEGAIASLFDGNYNAMSPYLFGKDRAVRISADSCAPKKSGLGKSDDYLSEQLKVDLQAAGGHCFDISVMFYTNEKDTPIEAGAHHDWKNQPKIKVAKLVFPQQDPAIVDSSREFCEQLQFSPWRTLAEHQPLGSLNRLRRKAYIELGVLRHQLNDKPVVEPTAADFPLQ